MSVVIGNLYIVEIDYQGSLNVLQNIGMGKRATKKISKGDFIIPIEWSGHSKLFHILLKF